MPDSLLKAQTFAITATLTRLYTAHRRQAAVAWADRGERALDQDRNDEAVEDFQTALAYGLANAQTERRLAEALIAANRPTEAQRQLLTQLDERPDDEFVNLDLARLAVAARRSRLSRTPLWRSRSRLVVHPDRLNETDGRTRARHAGRPASRATR
jgi:predicted Zn-dependent protease